MKTAETFENFSVHTNDLMLGDRVYAKSRSIAHVVARQGNVLCRFSPHLLPLYASDGKRFQLLPQLRKLKYGEATEYEVQVKNADQIISGRVCVCRRSPGDTLKEQQALRKQGISKCYSPSAAAMEYAGYILIFTTLPHDAAKLDKVFMIYRLRWQVELIFKRLKSILGLGQLHKYDADCVKASLAGKIFIALLLELISRMGDAFFPWFNIENGKSECVA